MFHKPLPRAQVRPIFCTRFFWRRIPRMTLGIRRLTSFRPDSVTDCFQVPGTSFRFLLRFNVAGNIARVQPGSPETAQRRPQGSQEPGESPCASRRLPERLPESSPGGVLKKIRTQLNQTALRMVNLKPLSQVAAIRALFGLCHEKEEPEPRRGRQRLAPLARHLERLRQSNCAETPRCASRRRTTWWSRVLGTGVPPRNCDCTSPLPGCSRSFRA